MELRHIRYFLAVAEERHFTRAAAKVGIGQPRLSQQIKDLEAEVGGALFHRLAHGAELTEAGKVFLAGVEEMPLIAERATMAARRAARGETGSLRVGFTSTATFNVVVPSAIRTFRRAYPEIHLTLEEANTSSTSCSCGQAHPVPKSYSCAGSQMTRLWSPFPSGILLPLSKRSISRY